MGFSVRLATEADDAAILGVLGEYLPDVNAAQRLAWLYRGNPHGRALTWIAFDAASGEVAGMTSFFRRRLVVAGRATAGALGGDGYVRPKFRRRGLGGLMHKASCREMAEHEIEVMFGTPMPANLTPLLQAGATNVTDAVRFARPFHLSPSIAKRVIGPLASRVLAPRRVTARLEEASSNDPRIDALWEETAPELRIATVRDAAFYTWRFIGSPSQKQRAFVIVDDGRAVAACALEEIGGRLRIVDLVAPQARWGAALDAIAWHGRDLDAIEIKLAEADGASRRLWLRGFLARDRRPINVMVRRGAETASYLRHGANWFFTLAEADMDFG